MPNEPEVVQAFEGDLRSAVAYLVVRESESYIQIMDVLEASVNELTPREIRAALTARGYPFDEATVEARLDQLRAWRAVSARTDNSGIMRYSDILARNWRYSATTAGRRVHRFYRAVLTGQPTVREIPLTSLQRIVVAAEALREACMRRDLQPDQVVEDIGRVFVSHDDLDASLVGAEDSLAGLADRFDLDDAAAGELKSLLVSYATRVAAELERGAARVFGALTALRPRFGDLAQLVVTGSDARTLIERGALSASRGGRVGDWDGLLTWFDPDAGRAARFAFRLVRALPGMHVNLRRLHSSAGTATSRARALLLAKACTHPTLGTAIFAAAVGDHPWRKLYGEADDEGLPRPPPWRDGPTVELPALLRSTGRAGARGTASAPRDDTEARAAVAEARARRVQRHHEALMEVLRARPGGPLSEPAARVALAALLEAVRAQPTAGRRTGVRDGLACSLYALPGAEGVISAPTWRVLTPHRVPLFHRAGSPAPRPPGTYERQSTGSESMLEGAR